MNVAGTSHSASPSKSSATWSYIVIGDSVARNIPGEIKTVPAKLMQTQPQQHCVYELKSGKNSNACQLKRSINCALLNHSITRMNPENIVLSEKRPVRKGCRLYEFIYTKCSEQTSPHKQETD